MACLLLGVVLEMSYCFNGSKYLLKSSSNELASFWFPQNETRTHEWRKQKDLQDSDHQRSWALGSFETMVGIRPREMRFEFNLDKVVEIDWQMYNT